MSTLQLVHKATGVPVEIGEVVTDFRGDRQRVTEMIEPHHPGSTGRVYVCDLDDEPTLLSSFGYFPSVFDLEWREVE